MGAKVGTGVGAIVGVAVGAGVGAGVWHTWLLHARVSAACGQAAPPALGCVRTRLRCCVPAPHDLVHVVQAPNEPTTQSAEHGWALQARVSA